MNYLWVCLRWVNSNVKRNENSTAIPGRWSHITAVCLKLCEDLTISFVFFNILVAFPKSLPDSQRIYYNVDRHATLARNSNFTSDIIIIIAQERARRVVVAIIFIWVFGGKCGRGAEKNVWNHSMDPKMGISQMRLPKKCNTLR